MVDRTYCTLYLIGEFSQSHAKRFASVIDRFEVSVIQVGAITCETFAEALTQPGKANPHALLQIGFDGVSCGAIPHELKTLLTEIGASYAWSSCTGTDHDSSISFNRVQDDQAYEMHYTINPHTSEILLTLSQAASPLDLKAAIAWRDWFANATFEPVSAETKPQPPAVTPTPP